MWSLGAQMWSSWCFSNMGNFEIIWTWSYVRVNNSLKEDFGKSNKRVIQREVLAYLEKGLTETLSRFSDQKQ